MRFLKIVQLIPFVSSFILSAPATKGAEINYPNVKRDENMHYTKFGEEIKDPYHALEDPLATDTVNFVSDQNKVFENYVSKFSNRDKFKERLSKMLDYEKYDIPFKVAGNYYYFYNTGLQPHAVLYRQTSLTDPKSAKPFFDPGAIVRYKSFSSSGKYFAYAVSEKNCDWKTIYIRETEDPDKVYESIKWLKYTDIEWTDDEKGFFYTAFSEPKDLENAGVNTEATTSNAVWYHRIGTKQSSDINCYEDKEKSGKRGFATVTADGKYVLLEIVQPVGLYNLLYVANLDGDKSLNEKPKWVEMLTEFTTDIRYISNVGTIFYFTTILNAPNKKIVKYDLDNPTLGFVDLIPEKEEPLVDQIIVDKDKLVLVYMHNVQHLISVYSLSTGKLLSPSITIDLPVGSIIQDLSGSVNDSEFFFAYSSYLSPGTVKSFDFKDYSLNVFREIKVPEFDASDFKTEQVFYDSIDSVKIPMFMISKKDLIRDGKTTTLLYAYGGFSVSKTPEFHPFWLAFIKSFNGIVCVANIRGGGEYGKKWHDEGKLEKKQNTIDDLQYAAKYLATEGYTNPSKLALNGISNGGTVVAACLNQAPELFGCALIDKGVLDMYKFHQFTVGGDWVSEYGNPDDKEDFEILKKWSPLHNISKDKTYPAVLLTTSDHDDRVVPLHSYKMGATLQHDKKDNANPILMSIGKLDHGLGTPVTKKIDAFTDMISFLSLSLNAEFN